MLLTQRFASYKKALFALAFSAFFAPVTFSPALAETIKAVIDGDTIILKNGRHVRLIGIDTPELGYKGEPSQAFAKQAKRHLLKLIKSSNFEVTLENDQQTKDRYGRTLAHVFLPSGENLSTAMLTSGFATLLTFPPNLKYQAEYYRAQSLARTQLRKRWVSLLENTTSAKTITSKDIGHGLFTGKVTEIRRGRNAVWIILDDFLTLKILKKETQRFPKKQLKSLLHLDIEVSGKLYFYKNKPRIRVRHPDQIKNFASIQK